ncbi:MAG: hypothetical protein ACUVUE_04735 [Candidatus Bathycorpusculaceae bacterium]
MKVEEAKVVASSVNELVESYLDFLDTMKGAVEEVKAKKKLSREGNKSRLIKIGLALIAFPEPTPISETIGSCFVAAGLIQKGIQSRAIYVEDVSRTFQKTLKEILAVQQDL